MTGTIILAQEGRFELLGDDGRATVIVLSHKASLQPQDLPALQHSQARVRVRTSPAPGLVAQVADDISVLDSGKTRSGTRKGDRQ